MSRRHVIMFQPRFAALVESGAKLQTIRPWRVRMIDVGDVVDLRTWTGLPYRSKQRRLREAMVCEKRPIIISVHEARNFRMTNVCLGYDSRGIGSVAVDALARADGFTDAEAFYDFFTGAYTKRTQFGLKLDFHGQLIRWQP
jgi:hypothetical protein